MRDRLKERQEMKPMVKYAVVTRYSFDSDMPVRLFETEASAVEFLRSDYENECRIDSEEGKVTEASIDEDGWSASIDHNGDVTEWRIGCVLQ